MFKTYKRPGKRPETRMYLLPKKRDGGYGYARRTPLSENEIEARVLFKKVTQLVANMSDGEKSIYEARWRLHNYKLNGKKYATLRGFIIACLYADLKVGVDVFK